MAAGFDMSFTFNGNSYVWEFLGGCRAARPLHLVDLQSDAAYGSFNYGGTAFGTSFGSNNGNGVFVTGAGTITVTSPTTVPEPGSLIFLGTGAVAIAGAMRRKLLSGIRS